MPLASVFLFLMLGYVSAQSSQQNITRIDDSYVYTPWNPNGIQYSAGWVHFSDNDAQGRYLNTLSVTTTPYDSAVFFFKGSSIAYYSDKFKDHDAIIISTDGRPPETIESWDDNAWQQLLWSRSGLDQGDHQIIISRGGYRSALWSSVTLDYFDIIYREDARPSVQGPGATSAPSEFLIDDGHDRITYEGSWSTVPSNQQSFYYGGLQHTTKIPGSSLTFTFNGTEVHYFSDKRAQNGWALISVDGGEGELVSTFLESSDDRWLSQVLCWSKANMSDGPHTVTITHSDREGKYISLDFFKYTPSPVAIQNPQETSLAVIIGSSMGGGVALLLAIVLCYWVHRRSSRSKLSEDGEAFAPENAALPRLERLGSYAASDYSEKWSVDSQSKVSERVE